MKNKLTQDKKTLYKATSLARTERSIIKGTKKNPKRRKKPKERKQLNFPRKN